MASLVGAEEPSQVSDVSSRILGLSGRSNDSGGCGDRDVQSSASRVGGQQPGGQQATSQPKAVSSLLPRELARI